jgi:hypothetical protein
MKQTTKCTTMEKPMTEILYALQLWLSRPTDPPTTTRSVSVSSLYF